MSDNGNVPRDERARMRRGGGAREAGSQRRGRVCRDAASVAHRDAGPTASESVEPKKRVSTDRRPRFLFARLAALTRIEKVRA